MAIQIIYLCSPKVPEGDIVVKNLAGNIRKPPIAQI